MKIKEKENKLESKEEIKEENRKMKWVKDDSFTQKEFWNYNPRIEFYTILPNSMAKIQIVTGAQDHTRTWEYSHSSFVHKFNKGRNFITVFCSRFENYCPLCYENEIFKAKNSWSKEGERIKTPYPMSKVEIVPVYLQSHKKLAYFQFTKRMFDQIILLIGKDGSKLEEKNQVEIFRTGKALNTSYRIDEISFELSQEDKEIMSKVESYGSFCRKFSLSSQEFFEKTVIVPKEHYENRERSSSVDISEWGLPKVDKGAYVPNENPSILEKKQSPVYESNNEDSKNGSGGGIFAGDPACESILETVNAANCEILLEIKIKEGVFANQTFGAVVKSAGRKYIEYTANSPNSVKESFVAKRILEFWESLKTQS